MFKYIYYFIITIHTVQKNTGKDKNARKKHNSLFNFLTIQD